MKARTPPLQFVLVSLCSCLIASSSLGRVWTLANGDKIEGETTKWFFYNDLGLTMHIAALPSKQDIKVPLAKLSPEDQEAARKLVYPWSTPEESQSYAFIGDDLWNLETGAIVGQKWLEQGWAARPIKNAIFPYYFAYRYDATNLGFAYVGRLGVGLPYISPPTLPLLGQQRTTVDFSTKAGYFLSQDLRRAFRLHNGDFWSAKPDWANSKFTDEKQVTALGVFREVRPLLWHEADVYVWGAFNKKKPVVKVNLESGEVTELEDMGVFQAPTSTPSYFANPSGNLVCRFDGNKINVFDPATGDAWQVRNHPDIDPHSGAVFAANYPFAWMDDQRMITFRGGSPSSPSPQLGNAFYLVDLKKKTIAKMQPPELQGDSKKGNAKLIEFLPGNKYARVQKFEYGLAQKETNHINMLVELDSGRVARLPIEADSELAWLNHEMCLYTRKEGGLSEIGTWLYDHKAGKSRRLSTQQAHLYPGTYAWFDDRNELWFQAKRRETVGSGEREVSDLYKADRAQNLAVKVGTVLAQAASIRRFNPNPIDLGITEEQFKAVQAQEKTKAGAAGAAATAYQILREFRAGQQYERFSGGLLEAPEGTLIGCEPMAGKLGKGSIFRIGLDGKGFTNIHEFVGNPEDGALPNSLVQGADGMIYGTTTMGGRTSKQYGTIFRIQPDGSGYEMLFDPGANQDNPGGGQPELTAVASSGNFYGVGGYTELIRFSPIYAQVDVLISTSGSTRTVNRPGGKMNIPNPDQGKAIGPIIPGPENRLYGSSAQGGRTQKGAIFSIDSDGGDYKTLHEFAIDQQEGVAPAESLVLGNDGLLYGVTQKGGTGTQRGDSTGRGTIFRLRADGSNFEVVKHLGADLREGSGPSGALIAGADGAIFGATRSGGPGDGGVIFRLEPATKKYDVLHSFDRSSDNPQSISAIKGAHPTARLLIGSDGALYGIASHGGTQMGGVLFRVRVDPPAKPIKSFTPEAAASPPSASASASPRIVEDKDRAQLVARSYNRVLNGTGEDRQRAFAVLREEAQRGDPRATLLVGACYAQGLGVTQDMQQAFVHYEKAAAAGEVGAMGQLGRCYLHGAGTKADVQKGIKWIRDGATKGDGAAMVAYSQCLATGQGIAKNPVEASQWMQRSAETENLDGMFMHGSYLFSAHDYAGAAQWWEKGARLMDARPVAVLRMAAGSGVREAQSALERLEQARIPIDESKVSQAMTQIKAGKPGPVR